jgi:hypothetical protein
MEAIIDNLAALGMFVTVGMVALIVWVMFFVPFT